MVTLLDDDLTGQHNEARRCVRVESYDKCVVVSSCIVRVDLLYAM